MVRRLTSRFGLRAKVILIIVVPVLALVLAGSVWTSMAELRALRSAMVEDTHSILQALSQDFERIHLLDQQNVAADISDRLQPFTRVLRLWAVDDDGNSFFAYFKPGLRPAAVPQHVGERRQFAADGLWVARPLTSHGDPYGWVHVQVDATTYHERARAMFTITVVRAAAAILIGVCLALFLQRLVTRPAIALADTARRVTERDDFSLRAEKLSNDELGLLADAFNAMLTHVHDAHEQLSRANAELEDRVRRRTAALEQSNQQLQQEMRQREQVQKEREELHRRLIETSRKVGMAEVASGVLHNVGNVLNSVNVSLHVVNEQLHQSSATNLARLADLIRDHSDDFPAFVADDERGKQLPQFLITLADVIKREHERQIDEVSNLKEKIEHVMAIVADQQTHAKMSHCDQPTVISEAIDEALRIHAESISNDRITIVKNIEDIPETFTDRQQVIQVLANLFSNARNAMQNAAGDKRLTITARYKPDAPGVIQIIVADTGQGILPEHMPKLFTHGFTTRPNGHGFGLHSSSLIAQNLGGALTAASDGPNTGAAFTLELPQQPTPRHTEQPQPTEAA